MRDSSAYTLMGVEENTPDSKEKERREAVIRAIERLSDDDMRTLRAYAAYKVRVMKVMVFHIDAQDLLHEAIERTLDGRRVWDPEAADFETHLVGCMRSIASQFLVSARRALEHRESLPGEYRPGDPREDDIANIRAQAIIKRIRDRLKADKEALRIFDRLREGYTRAEIRELLKIGENIYEAARKRIDRCIKAISHEAPEA